MDVIKITQYIHRPNQTELGIGNTHECYMLVGADIDLSGIFPVGEEVLVHDANSQKEYILKSSNYREFRINQLGDIYRDYGVLPGDEIIINQIKKDGYEDLSFSVRNFQRVVLLVKKGIAEINNIERLSVYETEERTFEVLVSDRGMQSKLQISFMEAKPKRADSPNMTDFYEVQINGERLPNGTYYLTLGENKNTIANLPKSDYNTIELDAGKLPSIEDCHDKRELKTSLQQIFYGAPGTGKSHTIKERTKGEDVIRTTFHPDSDYSTFVGAYKPTTITVPVTTVIGTKAVAVEAEDGKSMTEEKIVYEFVSQAFLQAYVEAWGKMGGLDADGQPKNEYLVIEEINRGNCAQIFGDLFQLLDRGEYGFSEYPIKADADMKRQLKKAFEELVISDAKKEEINKLYEGEKDIVSQVLNGESLLLPSNLYIWATMNTSDQSLFPIDSAFKRRWDWQYVPIADAKKGWTIEVNGNQYDWWAFLSAINHDIYEATFSEDKKLGYFFCKADDGIICAEKFVGKVIFYLWNDVFKDTEFDGDIFKDVDGSKLSFDKFYMDVDGATKVDEEKVELFLKNLNISPVSVSIENK